MYCLTLRLRALQARFWDLFCYNSIVFNISINVPSNDPVQGLQTAHPLWEEPPGVEERGEEAGAGGLEEVDEDDEEKEAQERQDGAGQHEAS